MSWGVSLWVYPFWDSLGFLDLGDYFLPHFREVFSYFLLKYFLMVFLFVFFFWDSYDSNVGCLTLPQRSLRLCSFLLIHFSFFLSYSFISTILSSISLILSSASVILFVASRVFLISFIIHYILTLFISSSSAAAKLLQLCLTLCDPIDSSPPGSPQFSSVQLLSRVRLFATP